MGLGRQRRQPLDDLGASPHPQARARSTTRVMAGQNGPKDGAVRHMAGDTADVKTLGKVEDTALYATSRQSEVPQSVARSALPREK